MSTEPRNDDLRVYWQPGGTSCLRTKEFLTRHGIPIVTRRDQWANGQVLADVARLVGVTDLNTQMLTTGELKQRLERILEGTERFFDQLPAEQLATLLPNRPRSYADLTYHIFNIDDSFLEEKVGIPLVYDSYNRIPELGASKQNILAYGSDVRQRLSA